MTHYMHYPAKFFFKNIPHHDLTEPQGLQWLPYSSQRMSGPWLTIKAFNILTRFTFSPSI